MNSIVALLFLSACSGPSVTDSDTGSQGTQFVELDTDTEVTADTDTDPQPDLLTTPVPVASRVVDGDHPALVGRLDAGDRFARTHVAVGDVDGDGYTDLAVGARSDDDGGTDTGAFYILFLTADYDVREVQKVSLLEGGLSAHLAETLPDGAFFGYALAAPGDLDGDGVPDLVTSCPPLGALFVVFLNSDGTVRDVVQHDGIANAWALDGVVDFDGDGIVELAAGDPNADRGAGNLTWLSVSSTGDVHVVGSIDGQTLPLTSDDGFGGRAIAPTGDINGDGWPDIVVGAFDADDGRGRAWTVLLDDVGNALSATPIGDGLGGLTSELDPSDNFGHNLVVLPFDDAAVLLSGANRDDDAGEDAGALYALTLDGTGQVATEVKWTAEQVPDVSTPALGRWARSVSVVDVSQTEAVVAVGGGARTTGNVWFVTVTREP